MRTLRLVATALCLMAAFRLEGGQSLVRWRSIANGEAESKKTGRPILYFMTADWCGPCKTMKDQIFADPKLAEMINATFVPIEVVDRQREEGQNSPEAERIFRAYRLRGFPTLTITRAGSHDAFQLAGWSTKKDTVEYLRIGKGRLEQMEKARREKEAAR